MSEEKKSQSSGSGRHFNPVDDHIIEKLSRYYKIEDQGEIIRFVKKHGGRPGKSSVAQNAKTEADFT